jgi:non-ribosomal peptide synthetase component F/acyl carrier protein
VKKAPLIYDKAMHEARKYWRDRLASISFDGHIALDHPRPKDGQQQLSSLEQELNQEVNALLQRVTAGKHFLTYTALVLALKICLSRYSGEPNVTVLSPATSEGTFANLLPVSSSLDGGGSFKDALLATKDLLSNAYRYQQYPFSRMLLDLPDERRPKHLSLIAAMAGFNEEIPDDQSDIVVLFETTGASTKATFRYDSRLYDESTVLYFFKSFSAILHQGLSKMTTRIADLRPDHAEVSDEANDSPSPTPDATRALELEGVRLHRLIEAQVTKQRESAAVIEGDRVTTYQTLNQHADQLAETLSGLRLDARKPVVILMDASTEMIAGMLAVMKIGAAFAPVKLLSVKAPIAEILKTLDVECIICQREHLSDLQQFRDSLEGIRHCITVERSASPDGDAVSSLEIARDESAFPADAQAGAQAIDAAGANVEGDGRFSTACVLIEGREDELSTSSVTHTELASLFQWLNERGGVGANDRCLLSPGLGACEQLYDTLGMLMAGASVEITDASSLKDTSLLAERLMDERITVWDLPTPLAQNLLKNLLTLSANREGSQGPRSIFLSGEKQSVSLAEKLSRVFPNARITGLYASPSVGIWSTFFPLQDNSADSGSAAIAQPITGFEHRVLNKNGELAPFHTKGELHLRRLLSGPEPELLKTGLRAERLEGGNLRWLRGEEHCFVKYGCCVELTKVEAILCQHEHILAAEVITIKADQSANSLVVAFIIAEPDQVSPETARDFLVLHDKVDLIPDRFILLDEFPLTAEGAIDRDALIGRFVTSPDAGNDARSIESEEIHRRLKAIWLEALQVDDVDEEESFFARGGNSLKATLLIARIRDEFSVDLSVQNFFRKPSTRAVAQLIEAESRNAQNRQKGPDFKVVSREKYRVQLSEMES